MWTWGERNTISKYGVQTKEPVRSRPSARYNSSAVDVNILPIYYTLSRREGRTNMISGRSSRWHINVTDCIKSVKKPGTRANTGFPALNSLFKLFSEYSVNLVFLSFCLQKSYHLLRLCYPLISFPNWCAPIVPRWITKSYELQLQFPLPKMIKYYRQTWIYPSAALSGGDGIIRTH